MFAPEPEQHSTEINISVTKQYVSKQGPEFSPPPGYPVHLSLHPTAAVPPRPSRMSDTLTYAAGAGHPQNCITSTAQYPSAHAASSRPASARQQQYRDHPFPGYPSTLEHVCPTGDPHCQQPPQNVFYIQHAYGSQQQQRLTQKGDGVFSMQPVHGPTMQQYQQQHQASPSHSPFSSNPFNDPYPPDSVEKPQLKTVPELRLQTVDNTSSSSANLVGLPVLPEVASPPGTPDSFTDQQQYRICMQQQPQQHHSFAELPQQPPSQPLYSMTGAWTPSLLRTLPVPYGPHSTSQYHYGSNPPVSEYSHTVPPPPQQQQRWSQPPSEYTTPRGTFEDTSTAAVAFGAAAPSAALAHVQDQLEESSKANLLQQALRSALGQQGLDVDQQVQQLLTALNAATCKMGQRSSSGSSIYGAASSTFGAHAAGQAPTADGAGQALSSNNPFDGRYQSAPMDASSMTAFFASDKPQLQYHGQGSAGQPFRTAAGHAPAAAAPTAAATAPQAAVLHHVEVAVQPAATRLPVATADFATAGKGSDGGAGLMPATPFANSVADTGAPDEGWQDTWQQGWRAGGRSARDPPSAPHMWEYNAYLPPPPQRMPAAQAILPPMLPQQPEQEHIMPVSHMQLARHTNSDTAAQVSAVCTTGSAYTATLPHMYQVGMLPHSSAGPHPTAAAAAGQMQVMLNAAAMAPSAMLVPAAVLTGPAAMQAAAAQGMTGSAPSNPCMAFGMYPAVPLPVPVPMPVAAVAAANMQLYQMMQQQQQQFCQAAAAAQQTATAVSVASEQQDGVTGQQSSTLASAGSVDSEAAGLHGGAIEATSAAIDGSIVNGNNNLAMQECSSKDACLLARRSSSTAVQPLFPTAAWPVSVTQAAVAWLLGKSSHVWGTYDSSGSPAPWASTSHGFSRSRSEQQLVAMPHGLDGYGWSTVAHVGNFPLAVAITARDAAAQGMSLVTQSSAAIVHMYLMALVWYAHYQLVFVLYALLGLTSAAVASQQLMMGAVKLAATGTAQLGVFAAKQARLFTSAAVRVISSDLGKLPQQLLLQPLLAQPLLKMPSNQMVLAGLPAAQVEGLDLQWDAAIRCTGGFGAAALPGTATSTADPGVKGTQSIALPMGGWSQSVLGYMNGSGSNSGNDARPNTVGATAAIAYELPASSSQQHRAMSRTGSMVDTVALLQQQQTESQQRQQHNLHVVDSMSVISGLWVGLGIKLWMLVSIRVPVEASRIWMLACSQGASLSTAAALAAVSYALHACWLLVQCSALIIANTRLRLPQAGAATVALASRIANCAVELAGQVVLVWWVHLGSPATAATQATLKATSQSVPGGMLLLQCLSAGARFASFALQGFAGGAVHVWQWASTVDEQAWKSLSMHSVLTQLVSWGLTAAAWGSGEVFGVAENLCVAATTRVLQGTPPMAQAAVWGSAGMMKRLVLEASQQSWLLLLGLYHAWQEQQQ